MCNSPHEAERGILIVADITLYDRGSLAEALGAAGEQDRLSDHELVVRAFDRWGADCFGRLNGDFAIALFDGRSDRLYLARDHSGLRPLHYRRDGEGVDFCSMPRPLATLDGRTPAPDWDRWLQFHAMTPESGSRSFFEGVERVEPAQVVAIDPGGIRKWRHWVPPAEPLDLPYRQVVEAVTERLQAATRDRRRGSGRVLAAQLSSGLDSSAVVSFAASDGHPLLALTGVPEPADYAHLPPGYIADEGDIAAETASLYPSVEHRRVRAVAEPLLDSVDRLHLACEQPQRSLANYGWSEATFAEASRAGADVILSGNSGNLFFSPFGTHAFSELLASGKFREWGRLALQHWRKTPVRVSGIIAYSLPAFLPAPVFRLAMRSKGRVQVDNFHDHYLNMASDRIRDAHREARRHGWLSGAPEPDGRKLFASALQWNDPGAVNFGFRRLYGLEERDPTSDRRLLEITLALPSKYFIHGGEPRSLARDVLRGRASQRTLGGIRGKQGQDWALRYQQSRAGFADEIAAMRDHPILPELIDVDRLARDEALFATDDRRQENWFRYELVMRTIGMARFARTIGGG